MVKCRKCGALKADPFGECVLCRDTEEARARVAALESEEPPPVDRNADRYWQIWRAMTREERQSVLWLREWLRQCRHASNDELEEAREADHFKVLANLNKSEAWAQLNRSEQDAVLWLQKWLREDGPRDIGRPRDQRLARYREELRRRALPDWELDALWSDQLWVIALVPEDIAPELV